MVAVLVVAGDGVPSERGVHADLVGAAGAEVDRQHRGTRAEEVDRRERRRRLLAARLDAHDALARRAGLGVERRVDRLLAEVPGALHERQVLLLDLSVAQQLVHHPKCRPVARDDEQAARVAVEAVGELEFLGRPRGPERLDQSVAEAATAVHREAGWLGDDQEVVVLVDDRRLDRLDEAGRGAPNAGGRRLLDRADRWQADDVPGRDPLLGLGPLAVDPDLALAQQPVYAGLRQPLEGPDQPVVEALAVVALRHLDVARLAAGCRGGFWVGFVRH